MTHAKKILLITLVVLLAAVTTKAATHKAYPEPAYTVIDQAGDVELRHYDAMTLASATLEGDATTMDTAFRMLLTYIKDGGIPMTAPVGGSPGLDGRFTTSFTMPAGKTVANLPAPQDGVELQDVPARSAVAVRFSGLMSQSNMLNAAQKLLAYAETKKLKLKGDLQIAYYDNPYTTLPWQRRNEMLADVAGPAVSTPATE